MSKTIVLLALCAYAAIAVRLRNGNPDDDHFVHESIDHAKHQNDTKPADKLEKDFIALDRNADGKLDEQELMFRQYATGCQASVAQARSLDYLQCGDTNKDKFISLDEFKASTKEPWAACVKDLKDRRVHGFVRFFEADKDWDDMLSEAELRAGIIKMWGPAGTHLAKPLLACVDKNKNNHMDQDEFHDSISAYNPATRSWQMWKGTSDPKLLTCLEPAFKVFDAALVFSATDANKDDKLSKSELYNTMQAVGGPKIEMKTADELFAAADLDKSGYLNLDEFTKAGATYKGAGESFALQGRITNATSSDLSLKVGMASECRLQNGDEWNVYASHSSFVATANSTKP